MAMLFGTAAQEDLTSQYRALMPDLDESALPHWDLYAALRPAGTVTGWGLSPSELARARAGHAEFVQSAYGDCRAFPCRHEPQRRLRRGPRRGGSQARGTAGASSVPRSRPVRVHGP